MGNAPRVLAALGLTLALPYANGREPMDDATRGRIAAAAAQAYDWKAADVEVRPHEELDRGGCHFYIALDTSGPAHAVGNYAVLDDRRIAGVDVRGNAAATLLLRQCGKDAPADWWASVVARFSGEVGGLVLTADGNPFAIRKIKDAGVAFAPPALVREGDATTLSFFVMDVGIDTPYRVQAVLPAEGPLAIAAKPVSAGAAH